LVWELEGYGWRWGLPAAGVLDIQVREDLRGQGLGKFLMVQVLRFLQEQYFGVCEVQAADTQPELTGLCRALGMEQVDYGTTYIKDARQALPLLGEEARGATPWASASVGSRSPEEAVEPAAAGEPGRRDVQR